MSGLLSKNMFVYTIFGRFFDFAVGIGAALLYRSGRVTRRVERGPRRWALEFLPILCLGLIMLFEHGMHISGGYAVLQGWLFNYAIAMVTGVLILALTHEEILVSRLLAHRVPVYLGRISYALYLVQLMQPLGAILTRSMNDQGLLYSPTAYVVVSGISAFLYEFVEEPARRWLVRRGDKMKSGFTWLNLIDRDFGVRTKKQLPTMPDAE
jgi:peptidoglycan/LPS O-acetylase OafA/YrhL